MAAASGRESATEVAETATIRRVVGKAATGAAAGNSTPAPAVTATGAAKGCQFVIDRETYE